MIFREISKPRPKNISYVIRRSNAKGNKNSVLDKSCHMAIEKEMLHCFRRITEATNPSVVSNTGSPPQVDPARVLRSDRVTRRSLMVYSTQEHDDLDRFRQQNRCTLRPVWGLVDCIAYSRWCSSCFPLALAPLI